MERIQVKCFPDFFKQMKNFLVVIDEPVNPVSCQHLTDLVFQII